MDEYDDYDDYDLDDGWLYAEDEYDLAVSSKSIHLLFHPLTSKIGRTRRESNRRARIFRHQR